jgi:hypothetical protein
MAFATPMGHQYSNAVPPRTVIRQPDNVGFKSTGYSGWQWVIHKTGIAHHDLSIEDSNNAELIP